MTTTQNALEALNHSAATLGSEDGETGRFVEQIAVSKNGKDIVVRMTPDQVLRFVDMIAEELD